MCVRLLLVCLVFAAALFRPASATHGERLFPETGWKVGGRLLDYWVQNGGMPVFGLPLGPTTPLAPGDASPSFQLFERERLESHPHLAPPYDVLLGRLGDDLLRRAGRDWRTEGGGEPPSGTCRRFSETERYVCGEFLGYWRAHGLEYGDDGISERESLGLFGLPLTAPRVETNSSGDMVLTQWFERARFEIHPSSPAPVLLGRLGAELLGAEPLPLPPLLVEVEPLAVVQGHTTRVTAVMDGARVIRGTLGGVALPFVRDGDDWRSLAGVPAMAAPGRLLLRVEADLDDGRTVVKEVRLTVRSAGYPRERITLPAAVRERLANNAAEVQRERALVNAIWPQVTPERMWRGRFILPAQGRISSDFGIVRSYDGGPYDSFHEGLDIANATGTSVVAAARGRVVLAEPDLLVRGGAVILDHGHGIHTGYWHQSAVLVRTGDLVEQGQIIGRIGAKGMVTGPHLHWDVRIGPTNVQPQEWLQQEWP